SSPDRQSLGIESLNHDALIFSPPQLRNAQYRPLAQSSAPHLNHPQTPIHPLSKTPDHPNVCAYAIHPTPAKLSLASHKPRTGNGQPHLADPHQNPPLLDIKQSAPTGKYHRNKTYTHPHDTDLRHAQSHHDTGPTTPDTDTDQT